LIALSSDVVFSGPKMFHDEAAATTSAHPAAAAVLQWEQTLLAGGALVARTCAYGWAPAGAQPGLVERIVHALRAGQPAPVDGQRFATPIFAADLAPLLLQAARRNLTGLYHLSGTERASTFRLANGLASLLGVSLSRTVDGQPCRPGDASWLVETSLGSRRARRALDLPLPMLAEGLGRFVEAEPGIVLPAALRGPIEQAA
jgi:dTDP-4-dehydrorhamnose reductase